MKRFILILGFLVALNIYGQGNRTSTGMLSLGGRSTLSLFNDHTNEMTGKGVGGQFRLRFAEVVNTDWFFDYITSDILNYAHRTDYHIGWSVLFYPINSLPYYQQNPNENYHVKIRPYILAGHCFDYSLIQAKSDPNNYAERWSSAVQAGLGTHIEISPKFDISLTTQYMMHLGNHITTEYDFSSNILTFGEHKGSSLAGHLLVTMSLNYKIAKLWGGSK